MKISLDIRKSAAENANSYYQKSKKLKKKLKGAKKALQETLKKIKELERKKEQEELKFEEKEKKRVTKKKKWYEKFRHFFSSDNFLVIGGKDATSNEVIIKKYLEKEDLVFHAQIQGAPFFVIKNTSKSEIPEKTLQETAEMAVSYSKAWKLGMGSCDIYYVNPHQVSKEAPSGEYIGKGAFMISGKRNWFRHTPLQLGIGVKFNKWTEISGGPVSAIKTKCRYFAVIKPGQKKSKELVQEIKKKLLKQANRDDREKIRELSLNEIQKWIPSGKGMLSK